MGELLPAMTQEKLDTQRDVVKNERRWSVDNQPYGTMLEEMQEAGLQEEGLREEGWSFLAKPFRLPELLAAVHRILAPVEARRWREAKQGVAVDGLLERHLE